MSFAPRGARWHTFVRCGGHPRCDPHDIRSHEKGRVGQVMTGVAMEKAGGLEDHLLHEPAAQPSGQRGERRGPSRPFEISETRDDARQLQRAVACGSRRS